MNKLFFAIALIYFTMENGFSQVFEAGERVFYLEYQSIKEARVIEDTGGSTIRIKPILGDDLIYGTFPMLFVNDEHKVDRENIYAIEETPSLIITDTEGVSKEYRKNDTIFLKVDPLIHSFQPITINSIYSNAIIEFKIKPTVSNYFKQVRDQVEAFLKGDEFDSNEKNQKIVRVEIPSINPYLFLHDTRQYPLAGKFRVGREFYTDIDWYSIKSTSPKKIEYQVNSQWVLLRGNRYLSKTKDLTPADIVCLLQSVKIYRGGQFLEIIPLKTRVRYQVNTMDTVIKEGRVKGLVEVGENIYFAHEGSEALIPLSDIIAVITD